VNRGAFSEREAERAVARGLNKRDCTIGGGSPATRTASRDSSVKDAQRAH